MSKIKKTQNIETFIGCNHSYEEADVVLFGAPYDGTTSNRPGARFGGAAIRRESFGIETYSPYLDHDLSEIKVYDGGELELSYGAPVPVLKSIYNYTKQVITDEKLPIMLGGEHLVTLGAVRAIVEKYPDLAIIQFDAHVDLRDEYLGQKLSHACVMRRCWELTGDNRIFQFGVRSGDRDEFAWAKDHVYTHKFNLDALDEIVRKLKKKPVYFTIDLDVLDTSVFPATGTPEAGGIGFTELITGISKVCELNIVGCDLTELSPPYDSTGASTATACKILRELLLNLNA
ncbi:MAG: agmatinase [Oscillospiraceae bacterium]|jgi:agmatinase|nr:agmatinase [Oscillospiraceae bacterium]